MTVRLGLVLWEAIRTNNNNLDVRREVRWPDTSSSGGFRSCPAGFPMREFLSLRLPDIPADFGRLQVHFDTNGAEQVSIVTSENGKVSTVRLVPIVCRLITDLVHFLLMHNKQVTLCMKEFICCLESGICGIDIRCAKRSEFLCQGVLAGINLLVLSVTET